MRGTDRIDLLERVGRQLQDKYTFATIDELLHAWKIPLPDTDDRSSKRTYTKLALQIVDDAKLISIADELGVGIPRSTSIDTAPINWKETSQFRLFVSHISVDKDKAMRFRDCLAPYAISCFVAHEDITPTVPWQREIERALDTMDAFLAIHTKGFSASPWTQQEIGYAHCRRVKIISFKMGEDPTGFIAVHQALSRKSRSAEEVAKEIDSILSADPMTSGKLLAARNSPKL